jgi:hypothetical protein
MFMLGGFGARYRRGQAGTLHSSGAYPVLSRAAAPRRNLNGMDVR